MILEDFVIKEMGLSPGLYDKLMDACDEVILKKKDFYYIRDKSAHLLVL